MNTIDCKVRRSGTERVFGFAVRALARVGERAVGAVRTHRLGSQAGLSVVELVAGLTLVSIIAGTAVPTISRWYGQNELLRGADAVKMDVSRARMKAVSMNRYTRIRILSSKTAYALETSTDGSTWIGTTTINLPPGVTINTTTAEVRFDRRGFTARNDSITIANAQNKMLTVVTSATGRVRVQ
jgi:Tfp pilus assembly protein FimT